MRLVVREGNSTPHLSAISITRRTCTMAVFGKRSNLHTILMGRNDMCSLRVIVFKKHRGMEKCYEDCSLW